MKASIQKWLDKAKRRIQHRLRSIHWKEQPKPMLAARNIRYDVADRTSGLAAGGIGVMHLLAQQSGFKVQVRLNDLDPKAVRVSPSCS